MHGNEKIGVDPMNINPDNLISSDELCSIDKAPSIPSLKVRYKQGFIY